MYLDFDPNVHAVGADGQPRMKSDGSGYQKKRGRKGGGAGATGTTGPKAPPMSAQAAREADVMTNEAAARMLLNVGIGAAVGLIGPEWAPENKAEGEALVASTRQYFDAKGQVELSPEVGLAFALIGYGVPRFRHENTRSKFAAFGEFLKGLFSRGK